MLLMSDNEMEKKFVFVFKFKFSPVKGMGLSFWIL